MRNKLLIAIPLGLVVLLSMMSFKTLREHKDYQYFLESEKNSIQIFQTTVKSVVNITNIQISRSRWTFGTIERQAGIGSGFIWDKDGHIVTNSHVVSGGDSFLVSFHKDKKQYRAKLIGTAKNKDIAVLKLVERPKTIVPLKKGSSENLMVGQKAVAIGNPYGLDHTMTAGMVSALDREIEGFGGVTIQGVIQTDASINPGNSGGPLIDSRGRLIGMNTSIVSGSGASAGLGFAVPVDTIKRIVPQLIKHKRVIRPALGVAIDENRYGDGKGLVVLYTNPGGPAAKAGLQGIQQDVYGRRYYGDIILKIEGKETNSYDDIYHILDKKKIGDQVNVTILRDGKKKKVTIKLEAMAQ